MKSWSSWLASEPSSRQHQFLESLSPEALHLLKYEWQFWARAEQLPPPGDWHAWIILAGRGWGKTRTGAEWLHQYAAENPGCRLALVGETAMDARSVMIEGESGLLATMKPWLRMEYKSSRRRLVWRNGSIAEVFSAEDPEQLRGPQFHAAWCDEVAKWQYPASLDNLLFSLRLGTQPKFVATTTPRRAPIMQKLLELPHHEITRGSSYDNKAHLPETFLQRLETIYKGTRLGMQELYGELLTDTIGALWNRAMIEATRVTSTPGLVRIVVAVDPAVSTGITGIIVAGLGSNGHVYVLADATVHASPDAWARTAVRHFNLWNADRLVAEVNNGGTLVETLLRTIEPGLPVRLVRAAIGKLPRAEPVAALYEQGRVHHVGVFPELETELTTYNAALGQASPDRLDALVWAVTELVLDPITPLNPRIRGV
ncbi:MAG: DNA-packaging protein [Holosporales bacterium]